MNEPETKQYIQNLIEPLYLKIQELQKENCELKKRVGSLETIIMTQSAKTYMKNTASRENHLQESVITRKDDQNRSVSGGKEKPGWKSNTKIQEPKPINKQPVHYQKIKLKPPIPRINSKTPTKMADSILRREKSPLIDKKVLTTSKIQADKKQNPHMNPESPVKAQTFTSPNKTNTHTSHSEQNPSSKGSKLSSVHLEKPTIYIQKDAKKSSNLSSPLQTPNLQLSNATERLQNKKDTNMPDMSVSIKSQPSLQ